MTKLSEKIRSAKIQTTTYPFLGETVYLRRLSLGAAENLAKITNQLDAIFAVVLVCVVDENGQPVFSQDVSARRITCLTG